MIKKSTYFTELQSSYEIELEDLSTDSSGRHVLKKRLQEKRKELAALLFLCSMAPEIAIPAYMGAFTFRQHAPMIKAAAKSPGERGFPDWSTLAQSLQVEPWAQPMTEQALAADGGDQFLVVAAIAEFLRLHDSQQTTPVASHSDAETEDDDIDLAEAGDAWLAEQGFDSRAA